MRRALSLAVALVAVSAVPAQAHDSLTAARLGAEVQIALRQAGVQPASPAVPRGFGPRTLKLAIMPIQLPGATLPTTAQLVDSVAQLNAIYAATTGGKLKATAVIAPVYTTTETELFPFDQNNVLAKTIAAAVAHHVALSGATPVFIGASPDGLSSYGGPTLGALLLGQHWKMPSVWAHEIGHWQGLSHGRSPGCSVPGTVSSCSESSANEYGDYFDIMGSGADRFGAFQLRVLGLLAPPDAAAGAAGRRRDRRAARQGRPDARCASVAPAATGSSSRGRSPTRNVFMANGVDYDRFDVMQALPVGGVIVSRAQRRYTIDDTGYYPNPYRFAPAVGVPCGDTPTIPPSFDCGAGQVFMPGTALTVPGAFKLEVCRPPPPARRR